MLQPGTVVLGKYRIESILGQGGMGVVAKAHHLQLDKPVAVKCLRPTMLDNQQVVARFVREAQAAARLDDEHVCKVLDVGTLDDGSPYMVMEFLVGVDLGEWAARASLAVGVAVDLVLQACAALAQAHARGIVHRDIKPSNCFITTRPDGALLLKILDFGVAKAPVAVDTDLTHVQAVLGTPAYMSPEQMRSSRAVDARSDIWSLGVVLYEILAGRRPFHGRAFPELCLAIAHDPTPPIEAPLPPGLDRIVYRCLEKAPEQRYQDVAALAEALEPFAQTPMAGASIVDSSCRLLGRAPTTETLSGRFLRTGPGIGPISTLSVSTGQVAPARPRKRYARALAGAVLAAAAGLVLAFAGGSDAPSGRAPDSRPAAAVDIVMDEIPAAGAGAAVAPAPAGGAVSGPDAGAPEDAAAGSAGDGAGTRADLPAAGEASPGAPARRAGVAGPEDKNDGKSAAGHEKSEKRYDIFKSRH